jgi:hypothetical protein
MKWFTRHAEPDTSDIADVQDWLWLMRQLAPLLPYAVAVPAARVVFVPEQRRGIDGHR